MGILQEAVSMRIQILKAVCVAFLVASTFFAPSFVAADTDFHSCIPYPLYPPITRDGLKEWNKLPQIDLKRLEFFRSYRPENFGAFPKDLYTGKIDNQRVFIKMLEPEDKNFLVFEANLISILGNVGVGPKLVGVATHNDGRLLLAQEFVEGRFFKPHQTKWPYSRISRKARSRLEAGVLDALKALAGLGIVVGDFQMMVRNNGTFSIVDTNGFGIESPEKAMIANLRVFQDFQKRFETAIEK
jgi:hypothetical protein